MPYIVPIGDAQAQFPDYDFVKALTPSEQKAAFHVLDRDGRDLCLKLIAPNYSVDRLNREIQALQNIAHPNVVVLVEYTYSSKHQQQRHYIIEQFVGGDDLTNRLTGQPWPRTKVATFFAALASGLEALRRANVVHRDLKPNNIRVRHDDAPVIIDFGLARHLDLPDITKTGEGAAIGTPAYFAPEQFYGTKRDIDHRTDLFAFGVLLYEALIGRHPFFRPSTPWVALVEAVCKLDAHLADGDFVQLPKEWRLLVRKLLARQRVDRPQAAEQVAAILNKIRSV